MLCQSSPASTFPDSPSLAMRLVDTDSELSVSWRRGRGKRGWRQGKETGGGIDGGENGREGDRGRREGEGREKIFTIISRP